MQKRCKLSRPSPAQHAHREMRLRGLRSEVKWSLRIDDATRGNGVAHLAGGAAGTAMRNKLADTRHE